MRKEKSCGGVVYKKIDGIYYFVIIQSVFGHFGFPKGHVENDETEIETALREIKEETNLDVSIDNNFKETITYRLPKGDMKDVVFFVASYEDGDIIKQDTEISSILLLRYDKAYNTITYDDERQVLVKAMYYLLIKNASKIAVIGCPGSGKSYHSILLNKATNLDLYHIDNIFWYGDWKQITRDELTEKMEEIVKKKNWILDGNYIRTMSLRIEKADFVVYFKLNTNSCLNGYFYRLNHQETRVGIPETCIERYDEEFIEYIKQFKKYNKRIKELLDSINANIITIRSKKQRNKINTYLKQYEKKL